MPRTKVGYAQAKPVGQVENAPKYSAIESAKSWCVKDTLKIFKKTKKISGKSDVIYRSNTVEHSRNCETLNCCSDIYIACRI